MTHHSCWKVQVVEDGEIKTRDYCTYTTRGVLTEIHRDFPRSVMLQATMVHAPCSPICNRKG